MRVTVYYVDGTVRENISPEQWSLIPGYGVDQVIVHSPAGRDVFGGASLYWCRFLEDGRWAVGTSRIGPAYHDGSISEVHYPPTGPSYVEHPDTLPDMFHGDVKLGWWYPGTSLNDLRDSRG